MKPSEMNQLIEDVLKHQEVDFDKPVFFEIFKDGHFLFSWNGKNHSVFEFMFTLKDGYELRSAMDVFEIINMRFKTLEIAHYDRDDNQEILFAKYDF